LSLRNMLRLLPDGRSCGACALRAQKVPESLPSLLRALNLPIVLPGHGMLLLALPFVPPTDLPPAPSLTPALLPALIVP
jgi:hypothetical protein